MKEIFKARTASGDAMDIPMIFGAYRIVNTLDEGYTSIVLVVEHIGTKVRYAAKVIRRDADLVNLDRELRLLDSARHPNIVQLAEIVYEKDFIIIVTEYCPRGDLYHLISQQRMSLETVKRIFVEVVQAVDYLHQRGWAHRDIKPENVLIAANGEAKLTDFGISREMKAGAMLRTKCGTICYLAPEVVLEQPYDGKKSDIWSLGILLYVMATGSLPWKCMNTARIPEQIVHSRVSTPKNMQADLAEIILKCTELDPQQRPSTEDLLNNAWLSVSAKGVDLGAKERKVTSQLVLAQTVKRDVRFLKPTKIKGVTVIRPRSKHPLAPGKETFS